MKAIARLITGSLRATAGIADGIAAQALAQPSGVSASGRMTEEANLMTYLRVSPVEPQKLVWLVPQVGIDYDIRTSKGLHWNII
jgi:hypothetical protein